MEGKGRGEWWLTKISSIKREFNLTKNCFCSCLIRNLSKAVIIVSEDAKFDWGSGFERKKSKSHYK